MAKFPGPKTATTSDDWRNNNVGWNEKMCHLHKCNYGSDITIKICEDKNEKSFKAHRFVLSMTSEVFDAMLKAPVFKNPGEAILMLVNVNGEAFEQFLEFIYCKTLKFKTTKNAIAIHKIADKFNVLDLKNECTKYIEENLDLNNVMECMEFADAYRLEALKQRCNSLIQKNTKIVLNESNIHNWKLEWILLILDQPALSIKEPELFTLVQKWLKTCVNDECLKAKMLDCILPKFCFMNFTGDEFVAGPVKSGLLTKNQSLAILGHIVADENCHLDYPEGFNQNVRKYIDADAKNSTSTQPGAKTSNSTPQAEKTSTSTPPAAKTSASTPPAAKTSSSTPADTVGPSS